MSDELRIALDPVADAFADLGVEYQIGGSVASSALGVARSTLDVDLVADLRHEHVQPIVDRLSRDYYIDAEEMHDAIRRRRSLNLIHLGSMIKVDVFVLGSRPYDRESFARNARECIGGDESRRYPMASSEDIVLRKLEWFRKGDEVSTRQWHDVLGVLRVQLGALDMNYLGRWASVLCVDDLLRKAVREAAES